MKANRNTLIFSLAVFMGALWAWQTVYPDASAYGRYYIMAMLMTSGTLALVILFRLIRQQRNRSISPETFGRKVSQRARKHYRIRFDRLPHPFFVQKTDDRQPGPSFTCPVRDISETGISLGCTGAFANGQLVQGEIIFNSGRTAPVNGVVIREETDRTCLRLHCTIDPPLLMAEQREQISIEKSSGPRPVVSKSVLNTTAGSLPSHLPKGICRIKRP